MVLLTRKQRPVILKIDLISSMFLAVGAKTTMTNHFLRTIFEVNLCYILKRNTPLGRPCNLLNKDGLLTKIQQEKTQWRSFEISRRFAAHHAESLPANRWSLRQSYHEEVTNHRAHWTPLIRTTTSHKDTYLQWNWKFLNGLENFETAITHERKDFFAFCFFVREAWGHVRSQCKNRVRRVSGKCPSAIS